ncbi:hypothetical protein ES707_20171 [subsurface metagenome]
MLDESVPLQMEQLQSVCFCSLADLYSTTIFPFSQKKSIIKRVEKEKKLQETVIASE